MSDSLNNKNLLRFYVPAGFTPVNPQNYNYKKQLSQLEKLQQILGNNSTSLWSQKGNQTTANLYNSDAPELKTTDQEASDASTDASTDASASTASSQTTTQ